MALVHIDLAELDKIRQDLSNAQIEIAKRNDVISKKDEEIAQVKADKRTLKVTIKSVPKETYGAEDFKWAALDRRYDPHTHNKMRSVAEELRRLIGNTDRVSMYSLGDRLTDWLMHNQHRFARDTHDFKEETTTEYVNFDDVLVDLRAKVEAQVQNEINTLKKTVSSLSDSITNNEIAKKKALQQVEAQCTDVVTVLKEEHLIETNTLRKNYAELEKKYEDLRLDRDTRSTEQKLKDQIAKLTERLDKELRRKWWQNRKRHED